MGERGGEFAHEDPTFRDLLKNIGRNVLVFSLMISGSETILNRADLPSAIENLTSGRNFLSQLHESVTGQPVSQAELGEVRQIS